MKKIYLIILILFQFSNFFAQVNKQNPQLDKIDILHYDFEINLSDENNIINVLANVKVIFKQDVKEFFLDLKSVDNKKGMSVVFVGSNKYELEYKEGVAGSKINIGFIYLSKGEYDTALKYYEGGLELFESFGLINDLFDELDGTTEVFFDVAELVFFNDV